MLQQMAVTDHSVYLDTANANGTKLMNSGKIGMMVTGPWDLSSIPDIDYGVQVMPAFADSDAGHQTISGPDNWVVFDNGSERKQAAVDFVQWLTAAGQVKADSLATGDLPTRTSVGQDAPFVKQLNKNLARQLDVRRQPLQREEGRGPPWSSTPRSPRRWARRSSSVLLGKAQPAAALAAGRADDERRAERELAGRGGGRPWPGTGQRAGRSGAWAAPRPSPAGRWWARARC